MTAHSLEPLRPWKAEQLGGGYALSALVRADGHRVGGCGHRGLATACAADILAAYPDVPADRVRVIHNGIDTAEYQPDPAGDVLDRLRHRSRPAVGRLRRPGHPAEGPAGAAARGASGSTRRRSSCSARARRTRRAPGGGHRAGRASAGDQVRRDLAAGHAGQARGDPDPEPRHGVRLPVAVRAARHRQPGGHGLRHRRRRRPRSAASPRWSRTARPACWFRPATPAALAAAHQRADPRSGPGGGDGPAGGERAVAEFSWAAIAAQTAQLYAELAGR